MIALWLSAGSQRRRCGSVDALVQGSGPRFGRRLWGFCSCTTDSLVKFDPDGDYGASHLGIGRGNRATIEIDHLDEHEVHRVVPSARR